MEGGDEVQDNLNTNINNINQNNQNQEKIKKKQKRYHGKYFVIIVMIVLIIEYYSYTFHILLPNINNQKSNEIYLFLLIFNLLVGMMLWAYFTLLSISWQKSSPRAGYSSLNLSTISTAWLWL